METFTERNLQWSKQTAMMTVAYLYGLQYAFLLNLYGRRFLANKMSNGVVRNQQFSYPNLTRSFQLPEPIPLSNLTYYRNSDDFGFSLGLAIFLGASTFFLFLVSIIVLKICQNHEPTGEINQLQPTMMVKINDLFCLSFFYTTCFSVGIWLGQSGIKNLAKAMFYPQEVEVEQWQVKFNVDHPGWQLLSVFLILLISVVGMCCLFTLKYILLESCKTNPQTNTSLIIDDLSNKLFDTIHANVEKFLAYQVAIVIGYWLSITFIPFFADLMFSHVHQYSDYKPRSRFQEQVAFELVAAIIIVAIITATWIVYRFLGNNYKSAIGWMLNKNSYSRLKQRRPEWSLDTGLTDFTAFLFPLIQAIIWGVLFAYSFLVSGSGALAGSLYPSYYPGELLLSTIIVSAVVYAIEASLWNWKIQSGEDVHRSVLLPELFIIAYPASFANSEDFTLAMGQLFGGFVGYPTPPGFDLIGWAQVGLLLAFGIVSMILFTAMTCVVDCRNKIYS